ncbi:hypothetical protein FJ422_30720 [Mesorhizobium sp. B2-6-3]|uniref:hypothetical protein n=1 Tax=Mesorhizobium sp. B2-6-3 TaxID=2589914 RepID=UPI00112D221C|nr:hypothetical protein [Mesorhizobium sp. B2-6-3]TPJ75796.1 hypothetical protein FJ422_30720 [Mesorhizobium sp. B2-6-3]
MKPDEQFAPRFMTDQQLRSWFGLSERALDRLRATRNFPPRDKLVNKTDRRSVEVFFDRRAGLDSPVRAGGIPAAVDGEENFNE